MKPKLIGIGKAGSRLVYDFFSYTSDTPTAYEVRVQGNDKLVSRLCQRYSKVNDLYAGLVKKQFEFRKFYQEIFGTHLIAEPPELATVDSDFRNNEITNWIRFINRDGQVFIFPGRSFPFANHEGGCYYHIVSENLAWQWDDIEPRIIGHDDAEIIATAFSVGGGTGGGSAPIMSYKSKICTNGSKQESRQRHFMGIGILPTSSEVYREHETPNPMDASEQYNTGRFFTSLYAGRNMVDQVSFMDSVWLFSNDGLRTISGATAPSTANLDDMLNNPNLSMLNKSIAASLTTICNATSPFTRSEPNFDPIEMNSILNSRPFTSGYASAMSEPGYDREVHTRSILSLLSATLNNFTVKQGQFCGLSIPVHEEELAEVNSLLHQESYNQLLAGLKDFDSQRGPKSFRTAERVVMIYGQPSDTPVPFKDELMTKVVSTIFSNSNFSGYYFKHPGKVDYLLILMVNPFIKMAVNAIYYYARVSWIRPGIDDIYERFDKVIGSNHFDSAPLEECLLDEEQITTEYHGGPIVNLLNQLKSPIKVEKRHLIKAFEHLHKVYHHQKIQPPKSGL